MTEQQKKEYNTLSIKGKNYYDSYVLDHPNDTHEQAYTYAVTMIKLSGEIGDNINKGGKKTLKEIISISIEKARDFMRVEVPRIFEKVRHVFDNLLNRLRTTVIDTWDKIVEWFNDTFRTL